MGTLWKNYAPVIVLVPAIVGIHYGWYLLQQNEKLVPKHQQVREQPIVTVRNQLRYNSSFRSF